MRFTEFSLVFKLANIDSPEERLVRTIRILTQKVEVDDSFLQLNEVKLNSIIINEVSKVYLTKEVDKENNGGIYLGYKQLVAESKRHYFRNKSKLSIFSYDGFHCN